MSKITLSPIGSIPQNPTSAANTINVNNAVIQTAIDNTLSRDGTDPNVMEADLDMNSNAILNLPVPSNDSEPLRLADLKSFNGSGYVLTKDPNKVYAADYGVKGDGGDYTTQGQNAINAAAGLDIVWPVGSIGTKGWTYSPIANESPGLQWSGAGAEQTTFNYIGTPGGYLLTANTGGSNEFEYFLKIRDCRFSGAGVHVASIDYSEISNVYFRNITGDGLHFTGGGDPDSSAQVTIRNCFFGAMSGWGVYAVPSGSNTELSNLDIKDTDFWACGTSSTSVPPTSGGVAWRGIQGTLDNVGFTECQNVGVYVAQSGTSQQLILRNVDFENCESTVLPSFYCDTGLRICRMENIQFLQGNAPLVNIGGAWFTNTVSNLTIDGVTVRVASANNPWTGFKATGTPITDTNRIRNVWWQTFDSTGQNRYSGFTFDPITGQGQFLISALNTAKLQSTGVGATMPMYLGGANENGEYVAYQIPSGGITLSTGVLTPATTYYFYLYNSADVNTTITGTLTASTTAPTTTFPGGYQTKTGDPSMIFIGLWITDGSGNFQTGGTGSSWYPALNATLSNGAVGTVLVGQGPATTPVFTRSPQLGTVGSAAGSLIFANATSGTVTVAPPTGALGSATNTLQAVTDTVVYKATTDTLTNKTLTSPTLTTPVLGTPSSGTLTSCTGLPVSTGISGLGTGVATALAVNTGSAGSHVVNGGVLGTPSSGTLTNCTGLPNAGLVNSSVTIGTTTVSLGSSSTTLAGLTSIVDALLLGGTAAGSSLTLQSTSGTGSGDSILVKTGTNGSKQTASFTQTGLGVNIAGNPIVDLQVGGVGGSNAGFEVSVASNITCQAFNRNSSAYAGLVFDGASVAFRIASSGSNGLYLSAAGGVSVGVNTDPGQGGILANGLLKSQNATAGIGYATGAGGTVTQATSRTTGVTLNTVSGAITLFSQINSAISAATAQSFTLTNSSIAATDVVHVTQKTGTDLYEIFVTATAAGSCKITNYSTGGTTNEAPVFNFVVIKGVTS